MVSRRVRQRRHSALACRASARFPPHFRDKGSARDGKSNDAGGGWMTAALARSEASLEDRWTAPEGWFYMTGMQALVRLPIQQRLRDVAAGLNTGGYISGYRGSPMGRFDIELWRAEADPQAPEHRLPPRPQRGPRRDRDLGRAACRELSRRDGRGRVRDLVRQGPGRRSLGRRAAARQLHRDLAEGRRARARRRRPRRQILDRGQFLRHLVHRRRDAGPLSVEHPGADRLRPARHRDVALFRLLGRHEGGHRRRRGRRHGLCRPGIARDRHRPSGRAVRPAASARGCSTRRSCRRSGSTPTSFPPRSLMRAPTASTASSRRPSGARVGVVAAGKAWQDLLQALGDLGLGDARAARARRCGSSRSAWCGRSIRSSCANSPQASTSSS